MTIHEQVIVFCVIICCVCLIWCVTEITITAKQIAKIKYGTDERKKATSDMIVDQTVSFTPCRDINGHLVRSTIERGRYEK